MTSWVMRNQNMLTNTPIPRSPEAETADQAKDTCCFHTQKR